MSSRDQGRAEPKSTPNWRYVGIALVCALGILISERLRNAGVLVPRDVFLPLHTILEFASIVVSFAVFATGWFGFKQTGNKRDLFLGMVFLATAAIDFMHTFTYQNMPAFLGESGVGKATAFWTIARFIAGVGLVSASFVSPGSKNRMLSPRLLLASAVLLVVSVITLVIHFYPFSGRLFYDPRQGGLTPLKIDTEYFTILMYGCAFVLASAKRGWDAGTIVPLRSALLIAMFAELAFTMYVNPYSLMNFFGHLLKTSAYFLILGALFVTSIRRPYEQLSGAKEELQTLYTDAQEHRKEIEQSFSRIGSALSSSIRLDEALDQIADLAKDMLHADCSVVISQARGRGVAEVVAQRGGCHEPDRPAHIAAKVGKQAIDQGASALINDLKSSGLIDCTYTHENCLRSMVCAPMIFAGEALGVIAIYSHGADAFNRGDLKLLEAFATHAGVAIRNAINYERESRIADVLQRSLLSPSKTTLDGFEIASVYASAMEESQVGGDFYDVVDLGDGRVAVVIGDVSGKGLAAAVHTAMAKYVLRAYLSEGHSLAACMTLLGKVISDLTNTETFITMFCGILDSRTGEMVYVNAGHEPALYCADSDYVTLDATGPILGLGIDLGYGEKSITFAPGGVLLLYTDGISEARHEGHLLGTDRIGEALLNCRSEGSEGVARCIYQAALDFSANDLRDDVAILAVKAKG